MTGEPAKQLDQLFMEDTPCVCYRFERQLHASLHLLHKELLSDYRI